mmetsp:Transcript_20463/g.51865  ORF Transcript_20463/g.51865 Transcript_20463/m.51865 type:complete len:320 (-) Transcript_20463:754-1713(-)
MISRAASSHASKSSERPLAASSWVVSLESASRPMRAFCTSPATARTCGASPAVCSSESSQHAAAWRTSGVQSTTYCASTRLSTYSITSPRRRTASRAAAAAAAARRALGHRPGPGQAEPAQVLRDGGAVPEEPDGGAQAPARLRGPHALLVLHAAERAHVARLPAHPTAEQPDVALCEQRELPCRPLLPARPAEAARLAHRARAAALHHALTPLVRRRLPRVHGRQSAVGLCLRAGAPLRLRARRGLALPRRPRPAQGAAGLVPPGGRMALRPPRHPLHHTGLHKEGEAERRRAERKHDRLVAGKTRPRTLQCFGRGGE